jgi:hypothetical protein
VENQSAQATGSPDVDKPLPSPAPSMSAWWGRLLPGRPGKDHPFGFRRAKVPEYKWWVGGEDSGKRQPEAVAGVGVGDEAQDPPEYPGSRPLTPGETRFLPYPSVPLNEDEPIPVDNRSAWVRADRALGF